MVKIEFENKVIATITDIEGGIECDDIQIKKNIEKIESEIEIKPQYGDPAYIIGLEVVKKLGGKIIKWEYKEEPEGAVY